MSIKQKISALAIVAIAFMAFNYMAANYSIAEGYAIKFSTTNAEGSFSGLTGSISFDKDNVQNSKMNVEVDAASIKTGNSKKDEDARGSGWFNVKQYPKIRFASSSFTKNGNTIWMKGTLEIKGVKKEIQIPFTYNENGGKATFNSKFSIKRKDFGLKGPLMSMVVGNAVTVELIVPTVKQ